MAWYWWTATGVYAVGFVGTYVSNIMIGPVMPSLALVRAAVFPLYWLTGRPHGEVQRFD